MMCCHNIIVRCMISIRRVPPLVGLALVTHLGISRFYETVDLGDSILRLLQYFYLIILKLLLFSHT